ncbi:hypothetical protein EMEDMD4_790395 [Sinorhizobium medicae]|uniref:Uncharacterized protein n=1 Tax=Sinorhizobium medicae TaxID=110321 RepID=A0A508X683_9HYPH|nr:hypothetical protein EMEDMD4_790395 [Sinorhizobium medicae]
MGEPRGSNRCSPSRVAAAFACSGKLWPVYEANLSSPALCLRDGQIDFGSLLLDMARRATDQQVA